MAKASGYVTHDNIQPGDRVIIVCRMSGKSTSDKERRLRKHVDYMYQELLTRGAVVVDVEAKIISANNRVWLKRLGIKARRKKAKLVAHRLNRFIRHPDYHAKDNFKLQPRRKDFQNLQEWTGGVELVVLLHPDTPWDEIRGAETSVGEITSSVGWLKKRKALRLPIAIQLHNDGKSYREIGLLIGIPHTTVASWLN